MPHPPQRIGYIRCSKTEQEIARQVQGLQAQCDQLRIEYLSGASKRRPVFDEVVKGLKPGDTLVVWDFDRAFRSSLDAILTGDRLRQRGVHFEVIGLNIDTSTDEGELFYTILAAFAQYERRLISRRTREGMDAARCAGKPIGRPRKLTQAKAKEARDWIAETGLPTRYVAALLDISRPTLERAVKSVSTKPKNEGGKHPWTQGKLAS